MARHEKPVLLFAFANDRQVDGRYLRELPEEQRRLLRVVGAARRAGRCEPHALPHATVDDLADVLLGAEYGERIGVFHFAGHAGDGALLLESVTRTALPASPEGLATLLGNRASLQLVFLNACSTEAQAETFLDAGVPAVIATAEAIDDVAARDLAWRFYQGLAAGRSVAQAFEEATALLVMRFGKNRHQAYHRSFQPRGPQPDWPWRLFGDGAGVPIPLAGAEALVRRMRASRRVGQSMLACLLCALQGASVPAVPVDGKPLAEEDSVVETDCKWWLAIVQGDEIEPRVPIGDPDQLELSDVPASLRARIPELALVCVSRDVDADLGLGRSGATYLFDAKTMVRRNLERRERPGRSQSKEKGRSS